MNTESKLLLLGHAFDDLGYERVALKTHHRNERSQAAIARLGAISEGVLRHHMVDRYGRLAGHRLLLDPVGGVADGPRPACGRPSTGCTG